MHELLEVDIITGVEVKYREESFTNNTGKLAVIENGNFIDALALGIRLCGQILVDILEVGDSDVLLKLFVQDYIIIDEFDFTC